MAHRDRSQGFAFVYADLKKLLSEGRHLDPIHPVGQGIDPKKALNFNRDELAPRAKRDETSPSSDDFMPIQPIPASTEGSLDAVHERMQAIQQIKRNLDRLQSLHHRLHAMLEDLEKASTWRNKK